jgi:hypothetical protein
LLLAIVAGGVTAGILDAVAAFLMFGWPMPRGIASGLLGPRAFHGGAATWVLGLFLHFLIAFTAAAIYCLASVRLTFLREHFIICGLYYGMTVFLFMNLVVLPLSAIHRSGPFNASGLLQGIFMQMLIIGLPISISTWKFAGQAGQAGARSHL